VVRKARFQLLEGLRQSRMAGQHAGNKSASQPEFDNGTHEVHQID
jgi:hypothetical protein